MSTTEDSIIFTEVRRLNRSITLGEYLIIKNFDETVKLYSKIADKKFSRSEPIPALEENEFFLLLKPKLKKQFYGDIEVTKLEMKGSVLNVYYKEIGNVEYLTNKEKNPILILRVNGKVPSSVKLITLNK